MIRRSDDYSVLPDKEFNKIASVVNKVESEKLFDSYNNRRDAEIAATELKLQGFNASIEKVADNKYKVKTVTENSIPLDEAEQSGQFKKLAWGRYCFQRESKLGDFFQYNFDDGSIWKLATDDDGNPILVKEVDEEDEEVVIRNVQDNRQNTIFASKKKKEIKYASDITVKNIAKILYDTTLTDEFLHEATPEVKNSLYKMFNLKLDEVITSKLKKHNIIDEKQVNEIKKLTATALTMDVNSKYTLSKFINSMAKEHLEKIGQQRKYFDK